jgi:hypothetical protein
LKNVSCGKIVSGGIVFYLVFAKNEISIEIITLLGLAFIIEIAQLSMDNSEKHLGVGVTAILMISSIIICCFFFLKEIPILNFCLFC